MNHYLIILFRSIVSLIALAPSDALACGGHSDTGHVLRFHRQHVSAAHCQPHAGDAGVHDCTNSEKDCPDGESDNHCHCPGCNGNTGGGYAHNLTDTPHFFSQPSTF